MDYPTCKDLVNTIIEDYIAETKSDVRFREGMAYVLQGGKRLRSCITLAVLERLSPDVWLDYKQVCLIPEFIHTASLIIDDLPAFDDAKERRDQECIHRIKGEGLAYLLSFNLVTEAMLLVHKQLPHLKKHYSITESYQKYEEHIYHIINNISGEKALWGQLLSTFHTSGTVNVKDAILQSDKLSREDLCDILRKKTSSFFEIALMTGWFIGNGDSNRVKEVKALANLLGLCYQIYDDFMDYEEDTRDPDHFSHNYVYHRGLDNAYTEYKEYRTELEQSLIELELDCPLFDFICSFMDTKIDEYIYEIKKAN